LGCLKGHVKLDSLPSSDLLHTIEIKNVTMNLHGSYSCEVNSDINSSKSETFLTVIIGMEICFVYLFCLFINLDN